MGKPSTEDLSARPDTPSPSASGRAFGRAPIFWGDWIFAVGIALGLLAAGAWMTLHRVMGGPGWFQMSMDAVKYVAMVEGTLPYDALYSPRVLVPFLASLLPLSPDAGLRAVSYASLFVTYVLSALLLRQLGVSRSVTVMSLLCLFATLGHRIHYSNPYLTDAFALMALTAMLYCLVTRRDRSFGLAALLGLLGRESVIFGVPAFVVTARWRRFAGLMVVSLLVFLIPRYGHFEVYIPAYAAALTDWRFWAKVYMAFGFLWLPMILGLILYSRGHAEVIGVEFCLLFIGAVITSLMSVDIIRMTGILQAVAPVLWASYLEHLRRKSPRWSLLFLVLVALNILWAVPTIFFARQAHDMWELEDWYFRMKWPITLNQIAGLLLVLGSVYLLRDALRDRLRDMLAAVNPFRPKRLPERTPSCSTST